MIFDNQLRNFNRFLELYPNNCPLSKIFPDYFRKNKQMGSRDRKLLSQLVYSYFRIGNILADLPTNERLFIALFLCNTEQIPFLEYFSSELNSQITNSFEEKIQIIIKKYPSFDYLELFPFSSCFSDSVDKEEFIVSHLKQPYVFLRAIRGKEQLLMNWLEMHKLPYENKEFCFRLSNRIDLKTEDYLFEVQDWASQQVGKYYSAGKGEYWWDCCAASGGKSLMLYDIEPSVKLLVSDVRNSILNNLDERFKRAGLQNYTKRIIDLSKEISSLHYKTFDGIILDVPCSGSGTWGRTPEMINQFEFYKIEYFHKLQKAIAKNAIQFLKTGKPLIYSTCSVFKGENEDIINYLIDEHKMKLENMELIKGYKQGADTMFVARLIK